MDYETAGTQAEAPGLGGALEFNPKQATHRDRLVAKQRRLKTELQRVEAALAALDAHPELENFITTLASAGV